MLFSGVRTFVFAHGTVASAGRLHEDMLHGILGAPTLFFDVNPPAPGVTSDKQTSDNPPSSRTGGGGAVGGERCSRVGGAANTN